MTRYPVGHKESTRRKILGASHRLILQRGLSPGLSSVMKSIGLTKGGFYSHFTSKDDLIQHTLEQAFEKNRRDIERILETTTDGREAVIAILDSYLSIEHLTSEEDACPVPSCLSEISRSSEAVREPFDEYRRWLTDQLAEALPIADERSRRVAVTLISLAFGALSLAKATEDGAEQRRILAAARRDGRRLVDCEV